MILTCKTRGSFFGRNECCFGCFLGCYREGQGQVSHREKLRAASHKSRRGKGGAKGGRRERKRRAKEKQRGRKQRRGKKATANRRKQKSNDSLCISVGVYWRCRDDSTASWRLGDDWRCSRESMLSPRCQLACTRGDLPWTATRHTSCFFSFSFRAHALSLSLTHSHTLFYMHSDIFTYIRISLSPSLGIDGWSTVIWSALLRHGAHH